MFTVEDFFSELLVRMELGRVTKKRNLFAYSDLKRSNPIHFIIFLAIENCWNFLKAKRNDPGWLNRPITPAEVRFIRHHAVIFFGKRLRVAQTEIQSKDSNGELHKYQAGRALDIFKLNFVYVADHHNIAYRKKFKIDFPIP